MGKLLFTYNITHNTLDSNIIIHVVINTIDTVLSSNYKLISIEDLENNIELLNKLKLCHDSVLTSKYSEMKSAFGLQFDSSNLIVSGSILTAQE